MLNRFKNAFYGTSQANDDTVIPARLEYDYREAVISKRIRSALTRSSSLREDLLREAARTGGGSNNNSISSNQAKSQVLIGSNNNGTHQYSPAREASSCSSPSATAGHGARKAQQQQQQQQQQPTARRNTNSLRTGSGSKTSKFDYSRPEFLQLKTEDEIGVSADHQIRPIILPRDFSRLPWKSGYAECINAGKSMRNEDQAACYQDVIINFKSSIPTHSMATESSEFSADSKNCNNTDNGFSESISIENQLPWTYFGVFDGHAGSAVAVAAAMQLHNIIGEKFRQVAHLLIALGLETDDGEDDNDEGDEYADCTASEEKLRGLGAVEDENETETNKDEKNLGSIIAQESGDNSSSCFESAVSSIKNEDMNKNSKGKIQITNDKVSGEQMKITSSDVDSVDSNHNHAEQKSSHPKIVSTDETSPLTSPTSVWGLPIMIDICRNNITVDQLIIGALESAFWEMDSLIEQDKHDYKMAGGCTAIVSVFILGKLYVCNAGDSRAIVFKNNKVIPMSNDFTPVSERERILRLGLQRPEFLGNEFTHLEFAKKPTRRDLGKQMLYKDAYMTGWSMKTITYDDLRFPLVWGEGKRSRVLATIGVTRGFGDHELRAQYGSIPIKPFLTPEPEVKVLSLEDDETLTAEDVLIMGSDGLWDVTANEEAARIVKGSFDLFPDNEESRSRYRYITAAQDLVIHSRGNTENWNSVWRTNDDRFASLDDIAVFVIPLKQYQEEYLDWKRLRAKARSRAAEAAREAAAALRRDDGSNNSQRQFSTDDSQASGAG